MIPTECFESGWLKAKAREMNSCAPQLLERCIHALALLGNLQRAGVPLVFRGGTSLLLHLEDHFVDVTDMIAVGIRKFRITAADGKNYETAHYNLDVINSVTRKPVAELDWVHADAPGGGPRPPIAPINAPKSGGNASINAPRNLLHRQILDLIRSNPEISYDDLARLTGKDRTTVMRNISKLKTLGSLKRIGSKKTCYWEIIE